MFVTIITISYNAEELIERTIRSILNQSSTDYEYLIVDGASKDKTLEIAKSFKNDFTDKDVPFRWISAPDNGIYDAMNKGLKMAKGDYIWFVNCGDSIASSTVLSEIIQKNSDSSADFIYGETQIVHFDGSIMGARRLKAPKKLTWKKFRMGMLVCHQSMLVRTSIAPFFETNYRYSSDFDWAIKCLKKSNNILNVEQILSLFLDGGVSKSKMKASLKERFEIMALNYGWFPTALRHGWFVLRAGWFKLVHGWI